MNKNFYKIKLKFSFSNYCVIIFNEFLVTNLFFVLFSLLMERSEIYSQKGLEV